MPDVRTEITEIITGLGTLGLPDLASAIYAHHPQLINVLPMHWEQLAVAYKSGRFEREFAESWVNGNFFLHSSEGLRDRVPIRVEWKGLHKPPGYDLLPADLRLDHVFLVSCKNLSKLLMNVAPSYLFDRLLHVRTGPIPLDWYVEVANDAFEFFYQQVRDTLRSEISLPRSVTDLRPSDRKAIQASCSRVWPGDLRGAYGAFSTVVAERTVSRWRANLTSAVDREAMLWRLLRLDSAPYFILGVSSHGPMRLRIATPWDWRQAYALQDLTLTPSGEGQPRVAGAHQSWRKPLRRPLSWMGMWRSDGVMGAFAGIQRPKSTLTQVTNQFLAILL